MLALVGVVTIATGTCLGCAGPASRFHTAIEVASGVLLVAGLSLIGATLPDLR